MDRRCILCQKEGATHTEIDLGRVKILCYVCDAHKNGNYEREVLAKIMEERRN